MSTVTPADIERLKASGLFNAEWYRQTYKDVDLLNMDPAEHYLKYGFLMDRDPGPEISTVFYKNALSSVKVVSNPLETLESISKDTQQPAINGKAVLLAAYKEACFGSHRRAIALAQRHLPSGLHHTLHILKANEAIAHGAEAAWLANLNAYLAHFGASPITLKQTNGALLDRLSCDSLPEITGGPLVSVIMPVWNAEGTVQAAVCSILNQTWRNLELLIVDDCSEDGTWAVLQNIAVSDPRVRIRRNKVNVGPYVSKNLALQEAQGAWITGHDADDWAHPQRLANHLGAVQSADGAIDASLTYMIRMQTNGIFDSFGRINDFSPDGITRVSSISALFRRDVLQTRLGFWDSVRFAADSEMISRARAVLAERFRNLDQLGMICLSQPTGLTNHPELGIGMAGGGLSPTRTAFKAAWQAWHKTLVGGGNSKMPFPQTGSRPYHVPEIMAVPKASVAQNLKPSEVPVDKPRTLLRQNGGPFRILARGDCTSRRLVHLNPDLFPGGIEFVQSQKSPAIFFLDSLRGITATEDDLREISDVTSMAGTLPQFYLGQADRKILEMQDVDLIMIDSYADMNFELWEHKEAGWKLWIHPKHLRNPAEFYKMFHKLGRRTLEQSIADIKALVAILRMKSPNAPVLFLNQQVDYYPKLHQRMEYYDLGRQLANGVENAYFGGVVARHELELADIGSCGPGLTLHFQAQTYRRMIEYAFDQGLFEGVPQSDAPQRDLDFLPVKPVAKAELSSQSSPHRDFESLMARDNPDKTLYPIREVAFLMGDPDCSARCPSKGYLEKSLGRYVRLKGSSALLTWTPVTIALDTVTDYPTWEQKVKKKYDRVRMKSRSMRLGYSVKIFHPALFVGDWVDINRSADARSGGALRGSLLKTVEDLGGYPKEYRAPPTPPCSSHWSIAFGTFQPAPGHRQGDVIVDERLLAYIVLRRIGDLCLYTQIVGHDAHTHEGVVYHCHFNIVEWMMQPGNELMQGVKNLMYGGIGNGSAGLWQWKRTSGFSPTHLVEI